MVKRTLKRMVNPFWMGLLVGMFMSGIHSMAAEENPGMRILAKDKGALVTIVIPKEPSSIERVVAEDLARYLGEIAGCTFRVMSETETAESPFYLGRTTEGQKNLAELTSYTTNIQASLLRVTQEKVILVGPNDQALSHGVYSLLHDLGCRWYTPYSLGEYLPKKAVLQVKIGDKVFQPAFLWRGGYAFQGSFERQLAEELTRSKDDPLALGSQWGRRNRFGGMRFLGNTQNYWALVPPSVYMKEHPEYYALRDGKRSQDPLAQLCTTNPEVRRIATETVLKWIRAEQADPYVRKGGMITVGPNDSPYYCECEKCLAEQGGNGIIENMIAFSNYIAREVRKEFPDVYIVTLVNYDPFDLPKKFKPESNVIPFINQWAVDYSKPATEQKRTVEAIEGWGAFGNPLFMYTSYAWGIFWPIVQNIRVDIPYFYEHGVRYLYPETHTNWALHNLNLFVTAQLLWDPTLNVDGLLKEYYANFFGPAAKPMQRFYEQMEEIRVSRGLAADGSAQLEIFSPDVLDSLEKCISEAKSAVQNADPVYAKRLEMVELGFQIAKQGINSFRAKRDYITDKTVEKKRRVLEIYGRFKNLLANPLAKQVVDVDEIARGFVYPTSSAFDFQKDNTLFGVGAFSYDEGFEGGGNAPLDAVKLSGFIFGRYGLDVKLGEKGELVYNFRCVPNAEFEEVWLKGLWIYSESARIDISVDEGANWTTVLENRVTKGAEIDITHLVKGKHSFLLRCSAEGGHSVEWTIFDNVGVRGTVVVHKGT